MAMGDVNAVAIGQASHIGLVLEAGLVSYEQLLCLRNPPSRGPLSLGVVIDDLVVVEKAARGLDFDPSVCHSPRIVAKMHEVYHRVLLGFRRAGGCGFGPTFLFSPRLCL